MQGQGQGQGQAVQPPAEFPGNDDKAKSPNLTFASNQRIYHYMLIAQNTNPTMGIPQATSGTSGSGTEKKLHEEIR